MPHAIKQIIPFSQLSAHPGKQNNNALVTAVYRSQSQSRSCRNPREEENERRAVTATTSTDGPGRTEKLRCVRWTQWGGNELSSPQKIIFVHQPSLLVTSLARQNQLSVPGSWSPSRARALHCYGHQGLVP